MHLITQCSKVPPPQGCKNNLFRPLQYKAPLDISFYSVLSLFHEFIVNITKYKLMARWIGSG